MHDGKELKGGKNNQSDAGEATEPIGPNAINNNKESEMKGGKKKKRNKRGDEERITK